MSLLDNARGLIDDPAISVEHQIFNSLAEVFSESQTTYAGHRRNIALLKKIQNKAKDQGLEDVFNFMFCKLTTKILPLKKANVNGDRVIKLIAGFIASWERHVLKVNQETENEVNEESQSFSKFLNKFMRYILRGIENKDKNIRYRVTQLVAVIMDNISEIDEELFEILSWAVSKRAYDKESNVRIQAIFSVTKFQQDSPQHIDDIGINVSHSPAETVLEVSADEINAASMLVDIMRNDSNAEVRRASMLNLVQTEKTLPYILERVRDFSGINRRLVYSRVLKNMNNLFEVLDKTVLDKLITWGLDDREESVRLACVKLITVHWLNMVNGDIVELLGKLDVLKSKVVHRIIEQLFETRDDVIDKIKFPREIWDHFTPEISFLLKCLFNYSISKKLDYIIEENYLDTVEFVSILSNYINKGLSRSDPELLFISKQLLEIALNYDYSDEVGRRDMMNLVRNLLYQKKLDEESVKLCIGILYKLAINEKDFITMTIEIAQDIRDESIEVHEKRRKKNLKKRKRSKNGKGTNTDDSNDENAESDDEEDDDDDDDEEDESAIDSFVSAVDNLVDNGQNKDTESEATKNDKLAEDMLEEAVLLKCLTISRYMLELVKEKTESIIFSSLIETLITPAVRNTDAEIRNMGVRNLGLCCLLDVELATENMYILGMCASKGNASLKEIALQVIVDIFSTHGTKVVDGEGKVDLISVHKIFYKILKNTELPQCQAIAAEGLCKLFLGNVISDDDLFETLILSYFSPANQDNETLIQAFAFCLPVYCFSHPDHQEKMSVIATDVFFRLAMLWTDLKQGDSNSDSMLKPNIIFQQLIHWTDPSQVVNHTGDSVEKCNYQLNFLKSLLEIYYRFDQREVKKMILNNVNKFYVCKDKELKLLIDIKDLIADIIDGDDVASLCTNPLKKFLDSLNESIQQNMIKNNVSEEDLEKFNLASQTFDEAGKDDESISGESSVLQNLPEIPTALEKEGSVVRVLDDMKNSEYKDTKTDTINESPEVDTSSTKKFEKNVSFILPDISDAGELSFSEDASYKE